MPVDIYLKVWAPSERSGKAGLDRANAGQVRIREDLTQRGAAFGAATGRLSRVSDPRAKIETFGTLRPERFS